jgi:methionyl aminopeptidase
MTIETTQDLAGLLAAGRVVRGTIAAMEAQLRPGITTAELDAVAHEFLTREGARSAPMIEVGYPAATCISVNDEAAHGLPGRRVLTPGDLVTLDVAVELGGYYADAAVTVGVPPVAPAHQRLCACAEAALQAAIRAARSGRPLRQIGRAAEGVARQRGYRVVRALHGHGIGRRMHEAPREIPNYDEPRALTPSTGVTFCGVTYTQTTSDASPAGTCADGSATPLPS